VGSSDACCGALRVFQGNLKWWRRISLLLEREQRLGSPIVRGIYYNPSVANLDNTKHIAFGNTVGNNRLNISSGNTAIGLDETTTTTSKLDVNGSNGYNQLRLRQSYTPTSSYDTNGNIGDVSWDDSYFYIKTSNGWKRTALSTF
jgi:hypothetical protein